MTIFSSLIETFLVSDSQIWGSNFYVDILLINCSPISWGGIARCCGGRGVGGWGGGGEDIYKTKICPGKSSDFSRRVSKLVSQDFDEIQNQPYPSAGRAEDVKETSDRSFIGQETAETAGAGVQHDPRKIFRGRRLLWKFHRGGAEGWKEGGRRGGGQASAPPGALTIIIMANCAKIG